MNQFLANALAEFLGRQPHYLVPATPEEFADSFQQSVPTVSDTFQETVGKCSENDCARPKVARAEIVVIELIAARRPLCVSELAARMGCSMGEASRRITLAGKKVKRRKTGRHVFVSLARPRARA